MSTVDAKIAQAEQILNHTFANKTLCVEAIQMAAPRAFVSFNGSAEIVHNNKRLAILGDATLAQALCKLWYNATTTSGDPQPREAWTSARNDILGNSALYARGNALGIGALILTAPGHAGQASPNMVATTFEALFGALYEDAGEAAVVSAIQHLGLDNHPSLIRCVAEPSPRRKADRPIPRQGEIYLREMCDPGLPYLGKALISRGHPTLVNYFIRSSGLI